MEFIDNGIIDMGGNDVDATSVDFEGVESPINRRVLVLFAPLKANYIAF